MEFKVHFKERRYFALLILVSVLGYSGLLAAFLSEQTMVNLTPRVIFMLAFLAIQFLVHIYFIGYLRGNAIKVSPNQFPEIFEILTNQSEALGLKKAPTLYLLQGNGMLNAFATRFSGQNYIVLYSDILAMAYQEGIPAVQFIIGHELGHIKRNHVSLLKSLFFLPTRFVPFLGSAYSRACEYTCDAIGYSICPEGAQKGILILAAGKSLYKKVNVTELLRDAPSQKGFTLWFAEIFSSHPHLLKRIAHLEKLNQSHVKPALVIDEHKAALPEPESPIEAPENLGL